MSSNWVFATKRETKLAGIISQRSKAGLDARELLQIKGTDFSEIYALAVGSTSVPIPLTVITTMNLLLHHVAVVTALLNGDVKECVHME